MNKIQCPLTKFTFHSGVPKLVVEWCISDGFLFGLARVFLISQFLALSDALSHSLSATLEKVSVDQAKCSKLCSGK